MHIILRVYININIRVGQKKSLPQFRLRTEHGAFCGAAVHGVRGTEAASDRSRRGAGPPPAAPPRAAHPLPRFKALSNT